VKSVIFNHRYENSKCHFRPLFNNKLATPPPPADTQMHTHYIIWCFPISPSKSKPKQWVHYEMNARVASYPSLGPLPGADRYSAELVSSWSLLLLCFYSTVFISTLTSKLLSGIKYWRKVLIRSVEVIRLSQKSRTGPRGPPSHLQTRHNYAKLLPVQVANSALFSH
jgi:hypothetical protein